MIYKSLRECANDLEKTGQLTRIKTPVSTDQELAEIHRRVYESQGPALLFENLIESQFQAISNIYGTHERTDYLFRDTIKAVKKIIEIKAKPERLLDHPFSYLSVPYTALTTLPKKTRNKPASMQFETTIDKLPLIKSWPLDGGGFVTLPQVLSMPPGSSKILESNLGMYRIQLSGNQYKLNEEIGLHYQIHRGIGVHHQQYNISEEPFKVAIYIGGLPSHALSAIFPLPEGMSELTFAGMLAGRRFRYFPYDGYMVSGDADFCILGEVDKSSLKPEGPFGDHLGYYSLEHMFPYMKVKHVFHRKDPLWHFTIVGRPPQEDSSFGYLIHQLVAELTPGEFPGIKEIHAVDVAGVHPLLLAIGSERYMPFRDKKPEEILTIANRVLGSGQTSLAKYLIIVDGNEHSELDTHDFEHFFKHVLQRIDWRRDLHFYTNTTIDTLDYSGTSLNSGSKVVWAVCGPVLRELSVEIPKADSIQAVKKMALPAQGILLLEIEEHTEAKLEMINTLLLSLNELDLSGFPLIVLVDDADFAAANWANFLWVAFTRSNPAKDIYGVNSKTVNKHWGCEGSLVIDARKKSHHAPELEVDKAVSRKVDGMFNKGGELYDLIPKLL